MAGIATCAERQQSCHKGFSGNCRHRFLRRSKKACTDATLLSRHLAVPAPRRRRANWPDSSARNLGHSASTSACGPSPTNRPTSPMTGIEPQEDTAARLYGFRPWPAPDLARSCPPFAQAPRKPSRPRPGVRPRYSWPVDCTPPARASSISPRCGESRRPVAS